MTHKQITELINENIVKINYCKKLLSRKDITKYNLRRFGTTLRKLRKQQRELFIKEQKLGGQYEFIK